MSDSSVPFVKPEGSDPIEKPEGSDSSVKPKGPDPSLKPNSSGQLTASGILFIAVMFMIT